MFTALGIGLNRFARLSRLSRISIIGLDRRRWMQVRQRLHR